MKSNPVSKFFYGNTAMMPKQQFEHWSMLTAFVAIGYIGYVTFKDLRGKKRGK